MEVYIVVCYDYQTAKKYEFPVFAQSPSDAYEFFVRVTIPEMISLVVYNVCYFPARAWWE